MQEFKIPKRFSNGFLYQGLAKDFKSFVEEKSAHLSFTNLSFADLSFVDLSFANLYTADLSFTNLSEADLSSAILTRVKGINDAKIDNAKLPIFSKWSINFIPTKPTFEENKISDVLIKIGCGEPQSIEKWDYWFYETKEEFETKRDSFDFKTILAHYEAMKAYIKVMFGE